MYADGDKITLPAVGGSYDGAKLTAEVRCCYNGFYTTVTVKQHKDIQFRNYTVTREISVKETYRVETFVLPKKDKSVLEWHFWVYERLSADEAIEKIIDEYAR